MPDTTQPSADSLLIHDAFLRRVVRYLIQEGDEVDDVVQEVWIAALKRPPEKREAARSWLWSVASNVIRLRLRSRVRVSRRERRAAKPEIAPSLTEIREREAVRTMVLEELLTLPESAREVLLLRFFEDLSWKQVARRLDVPPETARTRAKRARALLRERITARTGDEKRALLLLAPLFDLQHAAPLAKASPWLALRALAAAALLVGAVGLGWSLLASGDDGHEPNPLEADLPPTTDAAPEGASDAAGPSLAVKNKEPTATTVAATTDGRWTIAGRTLDEQGRALAGVEVHARALAGHAQGSASITRTSDASGRFHMQLAPGSEGILLRAQATGRAPELRALRTEPATQTLVLPRTGRMHFRLLDRDSDAPLKEVRCTLVATRRGHDVRESASSDSEGRVAVSALWHAARRTQASVRFEHPDYAPRYVDLTRPGAPLAGSPAAPRTIYLDASKGLAVHVIDAQGQRIADAHVRAWSTGRIGNPIRRGARFVRGGASEVLSLGDTRTNAEGTTHIAAPPSGRMIAVTARADEAAGHVLISSRGRARTSDITVRLRPTVTLTGRVVSAGQPVAGAEVALGLEAVLDPPVARRVGGRAPPPLLASVQTTSDAEGRFTLRDLPLAFHGRTLSIDARHVSHGGGRAHIAPEADFSRPVEIELPDGRTQAVQIVDESGEPVVGATVFDQSNARHGLSNAEGHAVIAIGQRKRATLRVRAAGFVDEQHELLAAERPATITLRRGRRLSGRILGAEGAPVGAQLTLLRRAEGAAAGAPASLRVGTLSTAASGWFSFEDVRAGPWEIAVRPHGTSAVQRHVIEDTKGPVDVRLDPVADEQRYAQVAGRVLGADGKPKTRYSIVLRAVAPAMGLWRPAAAGARFEFRDLPPGRYRARAQLGQREHSVEFTLRGAERLDDLVITFPETGSLRGRLLLPAGASSRGLRLRMQDTKSFRGWSHFAGFEDDGTFSVRSLPPGRYVIGLAPAPGGPWWALPPTTVDIPAGETVERTLRPAAAGRLRITADDARLPASVGRAAARAYGYETARPAPRPPRPGAAPSPAPSPGGHGRQDYALTLRFPDGETRSLGRLRSGSLMLDAALIPGRYELVVTLGARELREAVEIQAHKTTDAELRLPR